MARPTEVFPNNAGELLCTECKKYKHTNSFDKSNVTRGYQYKCKECKLSIAQVTYTTDKRHIKTLKKYNLTTEQYDIMRKEQGYACAICGRDEKELQRRLAVDHEHSIGFNRELLCGNCNNGLGNFKEDIEYLEAAIKYLRKWEI